MITRKLIFIQEKTPIYTKKQFLNLTGFLFLLLLFCNPKKDDHVFPETLQFSESISLALPNSVENSLKRKFADFTGDGITDMMEINREGFFDSDLYGWIYPGYKKKEQNIIQFSEEKKYTFPLPLSPSMWNRFKLDSGDINGDRFADIVLTIPYSNHYEVIASINQGDGQTFLPADLAVDKSLTENLPHYQFSEEGALLQMAGLSLGLHRTGGLSLYSAGAALSAINDEPLLKIDWVDMNKDKLDDLLIVLKNYSTNNFEVFCFISQLTENPLSTISLNLNPSHTSIHQSKMPSSFSYMLIDNLDTEDFDGNGIGDIIFYKYGWGFLELSLFLAEFKNNNIVYNAQKIIPVKDLPKRDYFSRMFKYDSFDANMDGRADFVRVAMVDEIPLMSFKFSKPLN